MRGMALKASHCVWGEKTEYGKHIGLDIGKMLSSQGRVL
jgi:hypothetical protein